MARQKPTPAADVDEAPQAPVATEPGCTHPECVLEHPHAGPAALAAPDDLTTAPTPVTDGIDEQHADAGSAALAADEPLAPQATEPAAEGDDVDQAHGLADAQAALDAARADVVALLPAAGYVIATTSLYVAGGARAHLPGDRVPAGNVVRNGWENAVRLAEPGE
ncbi:hypothetical protein AB0M91_09350 [Micromonospora rifamycinica]|uniref:hypothetical protein n=1 Tax=Micromonospora rifamycinica TaxID=291594 RepID=UPI003424C55A